MAIWYNKNNNELIENYFEDQMWENTNIIYQTEWRINGHK